MSDRKIREYVKLPGKLPKVFWGKESTITPEGIMLKWGRSLKSFAFYHELAHWLIHETGVDILYPLVHAALEKEGNIVADITVSVDLDEIFANVYTRYKKAPEKVRKYPLWMKAVDELEKTYRRLARGGIEGEPMGVAEEVLDELWRKKG